MKRQPKPISHEEFDEQLHALVGAMSASQILSYGDVYMILAEELNNDVIEAWEKRQAVALAEWEQISEAGIQDGDIITEDHQVYYRNGETYLYGSLADVAAKLKAQKLSASVWLSGNPPVLIAIP